MNTKQNVLLLCKQKLYEEKVEYPERMIYENMLRFGFEHGSGLKIDSFRKEYSSFGIFLIPEWFDNKIHNGLSLTVKTVKNDDLTQIEVKEFNYLPHQIYIETLLKIIFENEKENKRTQFTIKPIFANIYESIID